MKLSQQKIERISEQILAHLYDSFPNQLFTAQIAQELARDEEFIKRLLYKLKGKGLIVDIRKNSKGIIFIRRIKWQLSSKAYEAYHERATGL